MESKKIEEWWAGDYPGLSIKNYKKMSVYFLFLKNRKPFTKETSKYREAFWIDDNCEIYEWFDLVSRTGEKFGHDHYSDTKFYEYWWVVQPENIRKVRKVWLREPVEWGVEITYYPDYEDCRGWSVNNGKVVLESKKRFPDHSEGTRFGIVDTEDGPEEFQESFWEEAEKNRIEKEWKNPLGHGSKTAQEEGHRLRGNAEGVRALDNFKETWDKDSNHSFEEENHQNPEDKWGKFRSRLGPNQFKVEWSGQKPLLADPKVLEDYAGLAQESFKTLEKIQGITGENPKEPSFGHVEPDDLAALLGLLNRLPASPEDEQKILKAVQGLTRKSKKPERASKSAYLNEDASGDPLKDEENPKNSLNPDDLAGKPEGLHGEDAVEPSQQLEAAIRENIRDNVEKFIQDLIDWEKEKQAKLDEITKNDLNSGEAKGLAQTDDLLKLLAQTEQGKLSQLAKLAELTKSLSPAVPASSSEPSSSAPAELPESLQTLPTGASLPSQALHNSDFPEDLSKALADLQSEADNLFPILAVSSTNPRIAEVLNDFLSLDNKSNKLADDLLNELTGNSLQVNVWVNLSQGDFWDLLKMADSKSSRLLEQNLENLRSLAPEELKESIQNIERAAQELEKFSTETPIGYLQRVNKRLDLLQDLEALTKDLLDKNAQIIQELNKRLTEAPDNPNSDADLDELKRKLSQALKEAEDLARDNEAFRIASQDLQNQVNDLQSSLKDKNEELLIKNFELKNREDELRDKELELADKNDELQATKAALDDKTKALEVAENEIKLKIVELHDRSKEIEKLAENLQKTSEDLRDAQEQSKKAQEDLLNKSQALDQALNDQEKLKLVNQAQVEQLELQKKMMEGPDKNSELMNQIAEDNAEKGKKLADALAEIDSLKKGQSSSDSGRLDLENSLNSAKDELAALKKYLEDLKEAHKKSELRNIFKIFNSNQRKMFKKWLDRTKNPEKIGDVLGLDDESLLMSDEEEEKQLVQEYKAADDMLHEENRMLVETNIIMQTFKQIEGKNEKPMSYVNIFKFLEELIAAKYETDKKDTADKRQMRTMTEFMMERLQRNFGIQSLALKFLGQFIPGFFQLFNEGHKYAVFFARLLQLFHPEPVSYSLSLYLVRVAIEFNGLVEKCDKFFSNFRIAASTKEATHGRRAYEEASTGGIALVSDVIDYIYSIFAGDRESGTKALELMKPENIGVEEYVIFRICHKMAKLGSTPDSIFNTLDKDGGGSISSKELVIGLKRDLDLWVSEANINKLMESLDTDGTGDLSRDEFMMRISMKTFAEWTKKPVWTITKCSFLTAMIEVFKYNQRKLTAHLSPKYLKFGKPNLDKEEFEELMLEYDESLSVYDIDKMFNEGIESSPGADGVSFKVVALLMSKYGLGYLKSFKIKELLENLKTRKTITDISINPPDAGAHKKVKSSVSITSEEAKKDKNRLSVGLPKDPSRTPASRSFTEKSQSPARTSNTPKEGLVSKKTVADREESKKSSIGLPPLPDGDKSPNMVRKKSVKK